MSMEAVESSTALERVTETLRRDNARLSQEQEYRAYPFLLSYQRADGTWVVRTNLTSFHEIVRHAASAFAYVEPCTP